MSAHKAWTLVCDHLDCEAYFEGDADDGVLAFVRDRAVRQGWITKRGGKDYCPKHADENR